MRNGMPKFRSCRLNSSSTGYTQRKQFCAVIDNFNKCRPYLFLGLSFLNVVTRLRAVVGFNF